PLEGQEFLTRRGVPDPRLAGPPGTITGASDNAFAVGADCHIPDFACKTLNVDDFEARRGVPDLHFGRPAVGSIAGGEPRAGACARHTTHRVGVSLEDPEQLTGGGVPYLDARVLVSADDLFAVGADRHTSHTAVVWQRLPGVDSRPQAAVLPAAQVPLAL